MPEAEVENSDDNEAPPAKKTRKRLSFKEKAAILQRYFELQGTDGDASYRNMYETLGIPKSVLHRMVSKKEEIFNKAADETIANLKQGYPTNKHAPTFVYLYQEFKKARMFGRKVSFVWLWVKGKKIAAEKKSPNIY